MVSANLLNMLLRFFVGIKDDLFIDHRALKNVLVPVIFAMLWIMVCILAYGKKGEYGAPPGMLYMQDRAEFEEKQQ